MKSIHESVCPLDCPDTCSLNVTVDDGRIVGVDGSRRNPYTDGFICAKVRRYPERVYAAERILHPLLRRGPKGGGDFVRVSWDDALDRVASQLGAIAREVGPEAILPYHYGGSNGLLSEEAADARFFNALGACHLEKTICAAPTGAVARAMYGGMVGVPPQDYPRARLIIVWGANPAHTSIHLLRQLQAAKRRGATLVVVDPIVTRTARIADLHLRPRPGTDVALALGIARALHRSGNVDHTFLAAHTTGPEEFLAAADPFDPHRVEAITGVPAGEVVALATAYAAAEPALIRCGWGVERNRNGGHAVHAILALPALAGKFGRRGGGFTMSMSRSFDVDATALARPDLRVRPPRSVNMTQLGRALTELKDPPIRALFVFNANPVASTPDQNRILAGLARDDLFTVVHEQVMTDTALWADVVLPATTVFEQSELHKAYGHTILQFSEAVIEPIGEARSNVELFGALAARMGLATPELFDEQRICEDALGAERAREVRAERAVPMRFGASEEIIQFQNVHPRTGDGRVHLMPAELGPLAYLDVGDDRYPLILLTPASDKLVNSIFGEFNLDDPRLRLHPADAAARSVMDDQIVVVFNEIGRVEIAVRVTEDVPRGVVAMPKGIWRRATRNGATSTALVPDTLTDIGKGACFNDARVDVQARDSDARRAAR